MAASAASVNREGSSMIYVEEIYNESKEQIQEQIKLYKEAQQTRTSNYYKMSSHTRIRIERWKFVVDVGTFCTRGLNSLKVVFNTAKLKRISFQFRLFYAFCYVKPKLVLETILDMVLLLNQVYTASAGILWNQLPAEEKKPP